MTERKMGAPFYIESEMPPVGWEDTDYVEYHSSAHKGWEKTNDPIWSRWVQYRLEASHPHYTQTTALNNDDTATLEQLKASYPGLAWPELPDRVDEIVDKWYAEWQKSKHGDWFEGTARWIACKLIADGVLK